MLILNANRNLSRTDRQTEGQAEGHTRVKQYIPSPSEWGIIIQSAYSSVFINWRCAVILCGHDVKINELTCSRKNCMSKTVRFYSHVVLQLYANCALLYRTMPLLSLRTVQEDIRPLAYKSLQQYCTSLLNFYQF